MKIFKTILTCIFILCSTGLFAQDIITLRSGDDIESKVIEVGENEIKYKKQNNLDGPTYSIKKSKVFMIKYENGEKDVFDKPSIKDQEQNDRQKGNRYRDWEPDLSEYGGKSAIGIQILGIGLVGVIGRQEVGKNIFIEAGLHYRPILVIDEDDEFSNEGGSIMLTGGVNFITGKRYKARKNKIKFNGLFFKGGHGFSNFTENFVAAGWYNETFRLDRFLKSVQFELGLGILSRPWVNDSDKIQFTEDVEKNSLFIYLKVAWIFYK